MTEMREYFSVLGSILNLRMLLFVLVLVGLVLLVGYVTAKNKRAQQKKPGQYMRYEAVGRTAAQCMDLLEHKNIHDIFAYKLEQARGGGWYITLKLHIPTEQMLDTVFLLQFETETPARFSLRFVREAFGMREPVEPESMLDEFFAQKLDAVRLPDLQEEAQSEPEKPRRGKKQK